MTYNTARETFPDTIIAGATGFGPAQLFELEQPAVERVAPKVSFT
jgi:LemA protein